MNSKSFAGVSAGVLLTFGLSQTAGAADLPVSIPAAPIIQAPIASPLWSGFYVGGQLGYAFGADVVGRNPSFNDLSRRLDDRDVTDITTCQIANEDQPGNGDGDTLRERLALQEVIASADLDDIAPMEELSDRRVINFDNLTSHNPKLGPIEVGGGKTLPFSIERDDVDADCLTRFLLDRDDPSRAVLGPYGVETNDDEGFEAGVYVGADVQYGQFVFGLIGDLNYIDLEGEVLVRDGAGTEVFRANADLDWYTTLRARAGFAFDRFLVYAHGGLAYSQLDIEGTGRNVGTVSGGTICFTDTSTCFSDTDPDLQPVSFNDDNDLWGYAVGVGAEALLTEKISAKAEYQYTNLGEENFVDLFDETESAEVEVDFHTVRLGVAFRF